MYIIINILSVYIYFLLCPGSFIITCPYLARCFSALVALYYYYYFLELELLILYRVILTNLIILDNYWFNNL